MTESINQFRDLASQSLQLMVGIPIYEITLTAEERAAYMGTGKSQAQLRTLEEITNFIASPMGHARFPGCRLASELGARMGSRMQLAIAPGCALISLARQTLVANFIASGAPELLCLDADIYVSPATIEKMRAGMRKGGDVVLCTYKTRNPIVGPWEGEGPRPHPFVFGIDEQPEESAGELEAKPWSWAERLPMRTEVLRSSTGALEAVRFVEIAHAGFGCVLLSRRVLLGMIDHFPELGYDNGGDGTLASTTENSALFMQYIKPMGGKRRFIGEDTAFFCRAREAGFRVECLVDADVMHGEVPSNLQEVFGPAPTIVRSPDPEPPLELDTVRP